MHDNDIIDAIARALLPRGAGHTTVPTLPIREAARALAALRAAGYDIARRDTIRLGQAVEQCAPYERHSMGIAYGPGDKNWTAYADDLLAAIYELAGVERGGQ